MIITRRPGMFFNNVSNVRGGYGCSLKDCMKKENFRSKPGNNDNLVLSDLVKSKEEICKTDPDCKSCKVVTKHLQDANNSPPGSPLLMVEPSVLNTAKKSGKPDVVLDTYTTNCQCIESPENIDDKLRMGSCDPKLKKNREHVLEYMKEMVDTREKDNNDEIVITKQVIVADPSDKEVIEKNSHDNGVRLYHRRLCVGQCCKGQCRNIR